MPEPKVRFMKDDGSRYPAWKEYSISDLFTKIGNKNKDGQNTNVITNSAEFGLIPQRDYFDKDIAVEGNTGNYTIIQTGDFVYNPRKSSYAPMGPFNCYRLEEDGIVSPLYSCLRPKGVLNPEYLLWYFHTDKWYGYVNDHGAQNGARHDRVGMTDKILMGIPVTAPCEEEQQKIADFMSTVNEVITTSEEEVANLETQKKAVMKKIFSQEVRFKRTDGNDFPEWEEKTIGEIGDVITGSTPSTKDDDNYGQDYCFCAPGDLGNGKYVVNTEKKVSEKGFKSGRAIPCGSVLATCIGSTIGKMGIAGCDMITNQQINSIIVKDDDSEYIYYAIAYCFPQYLSSVGKQAVPILSKSEFSKKSFPLPCLDEQRLIADFLSDFDEAIAAEKKELELWKELKKGLLQQMFV